MKFIVMIDALPGRSVDTIRIIKHPKIPKGVKVLEMFGMFGKPDAVIMFEADDERSAAEFMVQFTEVADVKTSLMMPLEEMPWTL